MQAGHAHRHRDARGDDRGQPVPAVAIQAGGDQVQRLAARWIPAPASMPAAIRWLTGCQAGRRGTVVASQAAARPGVTSSSIAASPECR